MKIDWEGRLIHRNGDLRKHILFWSIPADIRRDFGLHDRMTVSVSIDISGRVDIFPARLFGGCEFKVPESLRSALIAHQKRGGAVKFKLLDFTDPNSESFQNQVRDLSSLSDGELRKRLPPQGNLPERVPSAGSAFVRNRALVAWALRRSEGHCEACERTPFRRYSDGEVYLEVHHIIPLAAGGFDSEENVIALCPECHRFAHFGDPKTWNKQLRKFFAKTKLSDSRLHSAQVTK